MRILITNITLASRSGTETYVRDLATGLLARGQTPIVFTPEPGAIAAEIRRATVPVLENLDALTTPPDVIHGHHLPTTLAALLHFPDVPAVFVCHDALAWFDTPPRSPGVLRYVAVDDTCRDRLLFQHAIPEDQVEVRFNAVDLERFRPRGPLPHRAGRALVFSNAAADDTYLRAVREACARTGLDLDVAGARAGRPCLDPETLLPGYDLVFAKARCAQEAMAVGAAVVLCDAVGCGPLVTLSEFDRLRRLNFGRRALTRPVTADLLAEEVARYDAGDATAVSRRLRAVAGLAESLDGWLDLYRTVIAERQRLGPCDILAQGRAAARSVRGLAPTFQEVAALDRRAGHAESQRDLAMSECGLLRAELHEMQAAAARSSAERERLQALHDRIQEERDRVQEECDGLLAECGQLREELSDARDSLALRFLDWSKRRPRIRRMVRNLAGAARRFGRLPAR